AAVPPISAALTFHLLLRLLDRAPALRMIAETYEERAVEEQERAALRRARRAELKSKSRDRRAMTARTAIAASSNGGDGRRRPAAQNGHTSVSEDGISVAAPAAADTRQQRNGTSAAELDDVRQRVLAAVASGDRVTGEMVAQWLGVSARTGRRRLSAILDEDPSLAVIIEKTRGD
ncbi:MAG: hypothetical protein ACOC8M_03195, partial [Guyparkeria sp.]